MRKPSMAFCLLRNEVFYTVVFLFVPLFITTVCLATLLRSWTLMGRAVEWTHAKPVCESASPTAAATANNSLYGMAESAKRNLQSLGTSSLGSHASEESNDVNIPYIHQTWKDTTVPEQWNSSVESCRSLNPGFIYKFWTDEQLDTFLRKHYSWFIPTYVAYPYKIQKIDAARLFLLYHFGGVYLDLDMVCKYPYATLLSSEYLPPCKKVVVFQTTPRGITNMMMVAQKRHPFFKYCIENLPKWNQVYGTRHLTVMFSAGPSFVSLMLYEFAKKGNDISDIHVMDLHDRETYFADLKGKSWHGNDSKFITVMGHHYQISILMFLVIIIIGYMFLFGNKKQFQVRWNHIFGRGPME